MRLALASIIHMVDSTGRPARAPVQSRRVYDDAGAVLPPRQRGEVLASHALQSQVNSSTTAMRATSTSTDVIVADFLSYAVRNTASVSQALKSEFVGPLLETLGLVAQVPASHCPQAAPT